VGDCVGFTVEKWFLKLTYSLCKGLDTEVDVAAFCGYLFLQVRRTLGKATGAFY
jgi:hypothetical protein